MSLLSHPRPPSQQNKSKCRVMLVDDSLVVRGILRKILMSDPEIDVVAAVGNGKLAVEELDKNDIEAVILDIEMPVMDGLTALPLMLKKNPNLVVLVASTLSQRNADISLKCLELGAKDYIPKPTTQTFAAEDSDFKRELLDKLKHITQSIRDSKKEAAQTVIMKPVPSATPETTAGISKPATINTVGTHPPLSTPTPQNAETITLRPLPQTKPEAIVIGSSTGGPQALTEVLKNINGKFKQPIFIAQHMPPLFTKSLATHLARSSGVTVKEGEEGEIIQGGCIYIAPGDFHMEVVNKGNDRVIKLTKSPPENFCRPSVNPLLRSVATAYYGRALCAMLTGLGADGSQGARDFVAQGGTVIAQDKATSVVWGMPGAVAHGGLCSAVLPLKEVQRALERIANALNPKQGVIL